MTDRRDPGDATDRQRAPATATATAPGAETGTDADACIALAELLARTSRRLRRGSMAQLTPLGVTFAQARVLRVVAEAEEPLRMADIAARLEVVPRSVTSMVDALEAIGVVTRSVDPGDRRSVRVGLDDGGRELLRRLDEARRASAEEVFGRLSDRQRDELHRLLACLCQGAACPESGGAR